MAADPVTVEPWPEPMSSHVWVDWSERYEADGNDGLSVNLHYVDRISESSVLVSAGEAAFTRTPEQLISASDYRFTRSLTWREVQARADDPAAWLRLDTANEIGGTFLRAPLELAFDRLRGASYHLELPDQSLFTPFDNVVPMEWAVIGLVLCSAVGIVFGLLPAIRASRLHPIDALRYE